MGITHDTLPDAFQYFLTHHCESKTENSGPKIRVALLLLTRQLTVSLLVEPKLNNTISQF